MSQASYETIVVYSLKQGEDNAKALAEKFKALIETNGTLDSADEWGTRRLAYAINYETEGYYVLYCYQAEADFPAEFDRVLKITEGVIRSLIVKKD